MRNFQNQQFLFRSLLIFLFLLTNWILLSQTNSDQEVKMVKLPSQGKISIESKDEIINLKDPQYYQEQIKELSLNLSSQHQQIFNNMAVSMQRCFEQEIQKAEQYQNHFEIIQEKCVGNNYSLLTNFFTQELKNQWLIVLEEIQFELKQNYCMNKVEKCLYFFSLISLLVSSELSIQDAFVLDEQRLQKRLGIEVFKYLREVTESKIDQLNTFEKIHSLLRYFTTNVIKKTVRDLKKNARI